MAKNTVWHDDYWLLLMQIFLQKPVGMKPLYSRAMVDLSLELHIAPQVLHSKMQQIARLETPRIERIWQAYSQNPNFYQGVEVQETFEKDFRPLAEAPQFKPVMLVLILDLYFRLTTITMVAETPEVQELARLIKVKPSDIVLVLDIFQNCDPYLNRDELIISDLLLPCQQVWHRYGNIATEQLAAHAEELKAYFAS